MAAPALFPSWIEPRFSEAYELIYAIGEDNPRIAKAVNDILWDIEEADALLEDKHR